MSRSIVLAAVSAALLCGTAASGAAAEEHVVKMRNNNGKGKFMIFEPDVVKAAPGDTVKFIPVDKGHNAEAIPEVWPEGKGELNQEIVLTLDKPGFYGIKCLPHYPMGMMALVVAGDQANKEQLKSFKPSGAPQSASTSLSHSCRSWPSRGLGPGFLGSRP